jgi:hypothetical protein
MWVIRYISVLMCIKMCKGLKDSEPMSIVETNMPKQRLQVTIRKDLIEWMDKKIEQGEFASYSHAIDRALIKLKDQEEK